MLLMKESGLSFEENLGLPIFKLRTSTESRLRLTRKILFWTISVYDYYDIGPNSVIYIFHKFCVAIKYR